MWDPRERVRKYLLWTAILIIFLIATGIATNAIACVDCDLNKENWNENSDKVEVDNKDTLIANDPLLN